MGAVCLASVGGASSAGAQSANPGQLFDRGFADMQAHRYPAACPALAESYRLEPHAGVLITLAECEYQWGHLKRSEELFELFITLAGKMPRAEAMAQAERTKLAADRLTTLAHDIPSVTLVTSPTAPPGTMLSLDGDTPTPPGTVRHADPGPHTAKVIGPSGASTTLEIKLDPAADRTVVVELKALPVDAKGPGSDAAADPRQPWFITAVVVGGAGLIAGGVLGGLALSDKSTITQHCPTPSTCDSSNAVSTAHSAQALGWGSTGAFAVGVAGAGAAIGLWLTRPTAGKTTAIVPVFTPPLPATRSYGSLGLKLTF